MEVVEEASESAAQGDLVGVQSRFSVFTVQRLERHWRQNNLPNAEGWIATGILDDPLAYKIWRLDGDFRGVELWAFEHTYLSAVVVSKSGHRIAVSSRDVSLDFEVLRVQRPAVSAP